VLAFHGQRAFALATVIALVPGLILASGDGIGALLEQQPLGTHPISARPRERGEMKIAPELSLAVPRLRILQCVENISSALKRRMNVCQG
jgi:hypothetical protein